MTTWRGRRALVVGLGVSGFASARALADLGARVRVTEASSNEEIESRAAELRTAGLEVEVGGHDLSRLDADIVVVSPGIPPTAPILQAIERAGIPVVSEIEVAFSIAECDFLAVTGTNGKTTTTSLLAAMLNEAGIASAAAGNIGVPLIEAISFVPPDGAIAVEVSSFQLSAIESFRPRIAVLLNISEDHTDWHSTFESYMKAKARIALNQNADDVLVFNLDDPHVSEIAAGVSSRPLPFSTRSLPEQGIGVVGDAVVCRGDPVMARTDIPLPGLAGLEDTLAAAGAAIAYGVEPQAVANAVKQFQPLPHRLQRVGEVEGVTYIDDSKATNPHATLAAVQGLHDVVLIAGGRSKGIDLSPLRGTVPPVTAVVALGEAAGEVKQVFSGLVPVVEAESMEAAVGHARALSNGKGSVLLSPACASLDMYTSYAARGSDFERAVLRLNEEMQGKV